MRTQFCSVSRLVVGLVVAAVVLLSIPADAIAECRVVVDFYNDQRRVPGDVNVECSGAHWPDDYGNGWGNWGVVSNAGGVRDADQFAGHKLIDNKKQWQSCTRRNPKPNCWYYNDERCTAQRAIPDNARKYASYTYSTSVICEAIGVETINGVSMHVYELDWPDPDDLVASLLYGDVDIPLTCKNASSCQGESPWIAATSDGGTVAARVRIKVRAEEP